MTTECIYVLKDKAIDEAKDFVMYLEDLGKRKNEEVLPTYISVVTEKLRLTSDYDGFNYPFTVKPGTVVVWAYGKDYSMNRLRPKGAKRGFPYAVSPDFQDKIKDLWVVCRNRDCEITGIAKVDEK